MHKHVLERDRLPRVVGRGPFRNRPGASRSRWCLADEHADGSMEHRLRDRPRQQLGVGPDRLVRAVEVRDGTAVALGEPLALLHDESRVRRAEARLVREQVVDEGCRVGHGRTVDPKMRDSHHAASRTRNRSSSTSTRCARTPTRRRSGSATCGTRAALDITWKFFSLEEVNLVAGKRHPWERPWSFGFGQMRVGVLIRRELGNDALDRWYEAVGHAFFYDGLKTHVPETHAQVIAAAGFDPSFVERAIADDSTLAEARAEHEDAVACYGAHGVPTIVFESGLRGVRPGRRARARRAKDAVALWELTRCDAALPASLRAPPPEDDGRRRCTSASSSARTSRPATGRPSRTPLP